MFANLREIFVRQYIGAILIALFVWQGAVGLITRIARTVYWRLHTHPSVLAPSQPSFPWENVIFSVVSSALYGLAAYGAGPMALWYRCLAQPGTTRSCFGAATMTSGMPEGAWVYVKRHALATVSAVLIYAGAVQIVSAIQYPIGNAIMRVSNRVIETAFRDRMLLAAPAYSILGLRPSMAR